MAGTVNWLFVDLNSYFASVEQELVPEPRHTVATNAIRNAFLAVGDAEEARTFAARSLQIGEEASYDGPNVAEIASKLGLILVGR